MKIRRLIALLTLALFLTGCGKAAVEPGGGADTAVQGAEEKTSEQAGENSGAVSEKNVALENQFALFTSQEEKGVSSTVITFNAEKVGVADVCRNATMYTYFDCLDNTGSTLRVGFHEESVEELYNETVKFYSSNMRENITLTDITDVTIGELTFKRYDVLYKGELRDQHYMLELDNGYILHNGNGNGYEANESVDIEEMLSYVFVDVEQGDGTSIRPSWGFTKDNDGTAVTYNFDSGETFVLDYPEDKVEISATGFVINVTYLDEKIEDCVSLEMHMSRKYDSLEPYIAAEEAKGYIEEGLEIQHADVNGLDLTYVCEEPGSSNSVYGLYYIDMPGEFSIRGNYRNFYEDLPVSLPEAVGMVLGADVKIQEALEKPEEEIPAYREFSAEELAEIMDVYGYPTPAELGATIDTATYSIDGIVYQFPTPVSVFLQNGWKIPEVYKEQYSEIEPGNPVQIALENEAGSIIYNVVVMNELVAGPARLEECMVTMMMVTQDSNVKFELPEGISFGTTLEDLQAMSSAEFADNAPYSTYSWWSEKQGYAVAAWYHPEIGIEYFEFMHF